MNELENNTLELRLAEQAILKEALDTKQGRIDELEAEVTYLRRTLNEAFAVPRYTPAPARAAAAVLTPRGDLPRRWKPQ